MHVIVRAMIVLSCIVTFAIHEGGRPALVASAAPENLRALSEWPGGVPPGCEPDAPSTTANGNVTIVTQSTTDRLWNLGHVCERWKGPLSLGMTVTPEDPGGVTQDAKRIMAACPEVHVSVLAREPDQKYPNKYEPFVAVPRCLDGHPGEASHVPRFDERYIGYGKNKIEWIASLRWREPGREKGANYSFRVVPDAFTVHVPHPQSTAMREWSIEKKVKRGGTWTTKSRLRMDEMFAKHMAALGLYVMDIPGVPAGDPAAVVEVDLATPLCGAVAHTIDKLETHSLAPAARAWLRGGEPKARGKGRDPTPLRWAQVDARLALPFAERIVASAQKTKNRNSRRLYRKSAP
ncbi:hypothetical protein JL720_5197 [Aureococcus anophagefferens]|nr:hypothetical protein JL720_5197 [Aureococcus anophagefferens]